MSELQIIEVALERAAHRRRWQRAWRGFWRGLLTGVVVWLLALVSFKVFPLSPGILEVGAILAGLSTVIGFITGWWRRPTRLDTARWVDAQQKLKERISTALEVAAKPIDHKWQELVINDAAKHAAKLDFRTMLPYRLPNASRWALLVLALAAGLAFVPEYRTKDFLQKEKEKDVIKEVGRHLADLAKRTLAQKPPAMEPTQKALDSVSQLGDELQKKKLITKDEAIKDLASMADRLKEQIKEIGKDPAIRRMQKAARAPDGEAAQNLEGMMKQLEAMKKTMDEAKNADPAALDKFKQKMEKLREAAMGMPDLNSPESKSAREELSKALAEMSKQAAEMGLEMPNLDEAIEALAASKAERVLKDLDLAMVDLDKMRDMAKAMKELKQQIAKLGKDLAEQLEKGQASSAQWTLKKMAKQLQDGNLTPEQMKRMMAEVSKAVSPAGDYGKVADFLKQAQQKMEAGEKPGAAKALNDAAKELDTLMAEMSDSNSLGDSLKAMMKAQMCIGNCTGWSQSSGMPKAGKGGKPGHGVGTWADEDSGWMQDPQNTADGWDNSGVERADVDGRGITDRGDGELVDGMKPDKIKGQFTPGGQMPSITLKGVSIKGTSNVEFKEAAAAAQSEAQSALSQEKVPRAYRGAVRDYFDDLKK
jgi:hypothetical protein